MFIQTETTPNPNAMKFIHGVNSQDFSPIHFAGKEVAHKSPLAVLLFEIGDVKEVFIGVDFITITKDEKSNWDIIKPSILVTIMDYLLSGQSIVLQDEITEDDIDDTSHVSYIKELIHTRIRPAVMQDGGDIIFHSFEEGIVKLKLHGACSGCPSASITLKNGIENMLRHYMPEIIAVEAV